MTSDTKLVPLQAVVHEDLKRALDQRVAASQATGRPVTFDELVDAALRGYLAEDGDLSTPAADAQASGGIALLLQLKLVEIRAAQQIAAELRARLMESPEDMRARAGRLDAMFAQWRAEAANEDPASADAEWEDFQRSMNANRVATGELPLYP